MSGQELFINCIKIEYWALPISQKNILNFIFQFNPIRYNTDLLFFKGNIQIQNNMLSTPFNSINLSLLINSFYNAQSAIQYF